MTLRRTTAVTAATATALAGVLLTACGDDEADTANPPAAVTTTTPAVVPDDAPSPAGSASLPSTPVEVQVPNAEDLDAEPEIEVTPGQPPDQLVTRDLVAGDGAEATEQDTVTVQYKGVLAADGTEFDSSWSRGEPVQFPLSNVIDGFREGIAGMKEGGRRLLIIPSDLAYGAGGTPDGSVPPNAALVFVVDLVEVV